MLDVKESPPTHTKKEPPVTTPLSTSPSPSTPQSTTHLSLSTLLKRVKQAIETNVSSEWISAELVDIKPSKGHLRLSLSEHSDSGQMLASCNGVIWSNRANALQEKFTKATGSALTPNIKVLVKVTPLFHPSFGFTLNLTDIDPVYTLGDIAKKLADIRQALRDKRCFDNQKKHKTPYDYTRVAVLSPSGAAGLGDFRRDAKILTHLGLTQFDYYEATFQGEQTKKSMIDQLRVIFKNNQATPYDCLVIIRGGGAVIDLNYLNEVDLAFAITQFTIPVYTGIGHEKDSTILDEVAHTSFDTPSKVILHIRSRVEKNALQAEHHLQQIHHAVVAKLNSTSERVHQKLNIVQSSPNQIINQTKSHLEITFDLLRRASVSRCQHLLNTVQEHHAQMAYSSHSHINAAHERSQQYLAAIITASRQTLDRQASRTQHLKQIIYQKTYRQTTDLQGTIDLSLKALRISTKHLLNKQADAVSGLHRIIDISSPENTVKRGFSIVRSSEGKIITDKKEALTHHQLTIEMRDGPLIAHVEELL